MMRVWIAAVAMLAPLCAAAPSRAAQIGPVCREPSVVDEITREIRGREHYSAVDPRLITEQPTTDPRIVVCQVCTTLAPYDTLRFGDRPVDRCVPHGFEVRILPLGFVVRDLR